MWHFHHPSSPPLLPTPPQQSRGASAGTGRARHAASPPQPGGEGRSVALSAGARLLLAGEEAARVFRLQEAACKPRNLPAGNDFQQAGIPSCSHFLDFSIQKFVHNPSLRFLCPLSPACALLLHLRYRVRCTSSKTTHILATFNKEVPKKRKKCVSVSVSSSGRVSTTDSGVRQLLSLVASSFLMPAREANTCDRAVTASS